MKKRFQLIIYPIHHGINGWTAEAKGGFYCSLLLVSFVKDLTQQRAPI